MPSRITGLPLVRSRNYFLLSPISVHVRDHILCQDPRCRASLPSTIGRFCISHAEVVLHVRGRPGAEAKPRDVGIHRAYNVGHMHLQKRTYCHTSLLTRESACFVNVTTCRPSTGTYANPRKIPTPTADLRDKPARI